MKKDNNLYFQPPPKPNYEIWIADNVVINCNAKPRWWHKVFIKLFFGWKYKKIKEDKK